MGIFKDTLYPFVHDQLFIRQSVNAHGMSLYGDTFSKFGTTVGDNLGARGSETGADIAIGTTMEGIGSYVDDSVLKNRYGLDFQSYALTEDQIKERNKLRGRTIPNEFFHTWTTSKYCGMRMASMVDITSEDILDLDYEFNGVVLEEELLGFGLARNYMLEGGTLLAPEGFNTPQMRSGFPGKGKLLGTAYGDPLSRADGRMDNYGESYGIVPMAGLTNASIRTKSAYGSLREAKIEFVCHNLRQLSVMELLYMRPGYPVLLEWGWTPYISNDAKLENGFTYLSDMDRFWGRRGTGNQTLLQHEIADILVNKRKNNSGCYDGILGLVKNFSYTARDDGGFNCSTELMAMGDVLSSLKPKNVTIVGNINIDAVEWVDPDDHSKGFKTITAGTTGANVMKLPTLADFLMATYDYVYGVKPDKSTAAYLGGGYKSYQERHYPGDDEDYGTEDDEQKRGQHFNRSPRNQTAPIVRDGVWYTDRRVTFNIDRDSVKANYESEFFDRGSGNIPAIFKSMYLMHFHKGRSGWSNFWRRAEDTLSGSSNWIAWGLGQAIDFFTDDARVLSEGYIRLDALLYILNSRCMVDQPKKPDQKVACYQTLQYFPNKNEEQRYKTHNMNSYAVKSQSLLKSLWNGSGYSDRVDLGVMLDASVDPYTCLMPRQFIDKFGYAGVYTEGEFTKPIRNYHGFPDGEFETGKAFDKSFPGLKQSNVNYNNPDNGQLGRVQEKLNGMKSIGHIMLNIEFLMEVHDRLFKQSEFTGYGVGNFLKEVLNGVNEATGGQHKLAIVTDNEFNHISNIVDLNKPSATSYLDIFVFDVLSNHSAVREFSFNTAIPTAMSSTIAVAAGNPDSMDSLDAVSFSALNRGISNRLYRNTPPADKKLTKIDKNKTIEKLRQEQLELLEILDNLSEFQAKVASGEYFTKGNDAWKSKVASNKHMLSRASTLIDIIGSKDMDGIAKKNPPTPTPIPITIDLTLDGISGIVIGQMFRINESRLPKVYRNKLICFLVVGEETSIDADGQWITKIKGQMQLFPGVPEELNPEKYDESGDIEAYNEREASQSSRSGETPWKDVGVSEAEWYSMSPREQERLKQELKAKEEEVVVEEEVVEEEEVVVVEEDPNDPGSFNQSNLDLSYEITAGVGSGAEHTWTIARGWNFAGMTGWETYVPEGKTTPQQRKAPRKTISDEVANELFFFGSDTPKNMVEEDRTIYYSEYLDEWAYDIEECYDGLKYLYEQYPGEFKAWQESGFADDFDYVE